MQGYTSEEVESCTVDDRRPSHRLRAPSDASEHDPAQVMPPRKRQQSKTMHTEDKRVQPRQFLKGEHASRCTARAAQGGWGGRGDGAELSSGSAHGRSERESTRGSGRVHRGREASMRFLEFFCEIYRGGYSATGVVAVSL